MGFGGINDDGNANYIPNSHMIGFTPNRAPGTGEIYNSVSEFINAVGLKYSNPGISLGIHYTTDYKEGNQGVNWIEDKFMFGFTKNRAPGTGKIYNSLSEFIGITGTAGNLEYTNPGNFINIHYNSSYTDTGVDYISSGNWGGPHAAGFTTFIQAKVDGGVDSEYHIVSPIKGGVGTIFDELTPGSGEDFIFGNVSAGTDIYGNTIDATEFVPGIKLAGRNLTNKNRGFIQVLGEADPIQELTLAAVYHKYIDKLIDWENVQPLTDVGASYDPMLSIESNAGGFLPFTANRGNEPYITRPIPHNGKNQDRKTYIQTHTEDATRLFKYQFSPDGVKFMGIQLASGIGAYMVHRGITHGAEPEAGNKLIKGTGVDRQYNQVAAGLVGGHQQFKYIYNPLSLYSSNVPYLKVRMGRSFLLQEGKYTDRKKVFGANITKNAKVASGYFKDINGADWDNNFDNQASPTDSKQPTTLGGDIVNNVNTSIDGSPINNEGISGDWMTMTPIDTTENAKVNKPDNVSDIHDEKHGFPFYFKDMRNEKILAFRGYIEDINENVNANWSETQFIGRSEPVYTYQNSSRDLNFTMKLYANNPRELDRIYEKLDYLTNLLYPQYFKDDSLGYTRPKPPLTRLRMANLYGGQPGGNEAPEYVNGVLGYIQSLNYSFDAPWESLGGNGYVVPRYIVANVSYKIINDKVPGMDNDGNNRGLVPHYGFKYGGG